MAVPGNGAFSIFDMIYCVSLPECNERRTHAQKEFNKVGIEKFQYFDAFGKHDIEVEKAFSMGFVAKFPPCFRCGKIECDCDNNFLVRAQVANFLTYVELWKDIIAQDHKFCLIVEDDIKFTDYCSTLAEKIFSDSFLLTYKITHETELLIRLGWARCTDHQVSDNIHLVPNLVKMSNPCHIITAKMAAKLLSSFDKISTTSDIYIHKTIGTQVTNYTLMPPLAYELSWSTGQFQSLIHPKVKHLKWLASRKSTNKHHLQKAEMEVNNHKKHKTMRELLVIGHPRCGSGYISKLLISFGLNIGHETVDKDGISSWMFAVYDDNNPYAGNKLATSRNYCSFNYTIHHIRDPYTAIPSIVRENSESTLSFEFRKKHILQQLRIDIGNSSSLTSAILSYLSWNEIIKKNHPSIVVKVEICENRLLQFCQFNEIIKNDIVARTRRWFARRPKKNINQGKLYSGKQVDKPIIHPSEWNKIDDSLKIALNKFCVEYGYIELFDKNLKLTRRK